MTDFETTDSSGDSPVKDIQEYKEHAKNVEELEELAHEIDGLADSMKVKYKENTELGKIVLFVEFYDDEDGGSSDESEDSDGARFTEGQGERIR